MKQFLRPEQMADLFLQHLFKEGVQGTAAQLSDFFYKRKTYLDGEIADRIIDLLLGKKLVKEVPQTLDLIGFSKPKTPQAPSEIISPLDFLRDYDIETHFPQFAITNKGRAFISHGLKLDVQGLIEKKKTCKKWQDRIINALIAIVTAYFIFWLTEPMKKRIAEQSAQPKTNNLSESSPIRSRLDERQRPEPGKPVDTAAPGGRARRRHHL